jgi:hypothetical protein
MKVWVANWDSAGLYAYATLDALKAAVDDYIWEEEDINTFGSDGYVSIDDYLYASWVDLNE